MIFQCKISYRICAGASGIMVVYTKFSDYSVFMDIFIIFACYKTGSGNEENP